MKIARFSAQDRVSWGAIETEVDTRCVVEIDGEPFGPQRRTGWSAQLEQVRLLAPVSSSAKIVGVGMNYPRPGEPDLGQDKLDPFLFVKPLTTVIGPGEPILLPPGLDRVVHEVELAVVIGIKCRNIKADEAKRVILGYTCANDVSALGIASTNSEVPNVVLGKSFDSFCPIGPWIETDLDSSDLSLTCRVNEELRQDSSTGGLRRGVPELIELVTRVMTLHPGDVILTGTPPGAAPLRDGDVVEVAVEGIGTLTNPVVGAG